MMHKHWRINALRLAAAVVVAALLAGNLLAFSFTPRVQAGPDLESASPIRLRVGSFVPAAGESLPVPKELATPGDEPGEPSYHIVQFQGPIHQEWKDRVAALGGQVLDYVPDFAFVVYMDAATRAAVAALPEVAWIGPFLPAYKLSPDLAGAQGTLDLVVQTFATEPAGAVGAQAVPLGAQVQDQSLRAGGDQFRLTMDAAQLPALARLPGVRWIEPFYERVLFNDVARRNNIMGAETLWAGQGLYGAGQVVAVSDTGLDTGSLASLHQDFLGSPTGCTGTGRIVATYALGRTGNWSDSCRSGGVNEGGHGTHVAGSVLGNGCRSGSGGVPIYGGSYAGLAPQAGLVFQSVMDSACGLGGLPADLNTLFAQAQGAGARIHTNSWGAPVAGQYTVDSENTDEYLWNHKDYTILFSAGNSGTDAGTPNGYIDADSIGAPGTAKNCITVGASENERMSGGYNPGGACSTWYGCWGSTYGTNPIRDDRLSDNAAGMVAFSSRGPTDDGRLKPDVVAPGSNILSTKSQAAYVSGGWGAGPNQYYQYMGGTSMSTPLTAGAMALIRDWYTDAKGVTPSGALLKATVINSAVNLHPGQYASPLEQQPQLPNNAQGWGRVSVANATDDGHVFQDMTDAGGLQTGGSHTYDYQVCTSSLFKVTLVWTDYPGSTLVNDLDLTVTAPGGTVYRGNVFGSGWSAAGGTADRANNVESVYIQSPTPGTWTVAVSGYNVPQGPRQGYALVVDMPANTCTPDFSVAALPASQDVCAPDNAVYSVAVGQIAGFGGSVALGASGQPAGTTISFSPTAVVPPASSTLTVGNTGAAAAGTTTIDIAGTSGALNHHSSVVLNLYAARPGAAVPATPAAGASGVAPAPAFAWTDAAGETGYTIEVATDPAFATVVHSAGLAAGTTSYSGASLGLDTVYYWRVRATNVCGSTDSAVFAFRTEASGCLTYASTDVPKAIPDNSTVDSTLAFPTALTITDVDVILDRITHTYDGDLDIYLRHGDGTQVRLSDDNGASGDNYVSTRFDDEAATAITAGTPPFTGSFRPEQVLSALDGKNAQGTWVLRITDDATVDTGTLHGWSLVACGSGAALPADYSDLAGSYGVAWHTGSGAPRIGANWTADTSFGPDADNATDDGVTFAGPFMAGQAATVRVSVQGTPASGRWLRVWFDWNKDGRFEDTTGLGGERVHDAAAVAGDNNLTVNVPAGVSGALAYRVRLYDSAAAPASGRALDDSSGGGAAGGEVTDGASPLPTGVTLAHLDAQAAGSGIRVAWETTNDAVLAGFYLLRAPDAGGPYARLNEALLPVQQPGQPGGAAYAWDDTGLLPGTTYYYRLEILDAGGGITTAGPVSATAAAVQRLYLPLATR